jgi:hypothetical protein
VRAVLVGHIFAGDGVAFEWCARPSASPVRRRVQQRLHASQASTASRHSMLWKARTIGSAWGVLPRVR